MKPKKQSIPEFLSKAWSEEERRTFITDLIANTHYIASRVGASEDGMAHALMLPRMFVTIATSISLGIKELSTKIIIEAFICLDKDIKQVPKDHIRSAMDALYSVLPPAMRPPKAKRSSMYELAERVRKIQPPKYIENLPVYRGMYFLQSEYLEVVEQSNKKKLSQTKAAERIGPILTYLTGLANGLTAGDWKQTIFSVLSASGDACVRDMFKIKDLDKLYVSLIQMISIGTVLAGVAGDLGASIHGMQPDGTNSKTGPRETGMKKGPKEALGFQADPSMFK